MTHNPDVVSNTQAQQPAIITLPHHRRIALLTDGYSTPFMAKTAISLLRYRPEDMVALIDRETPASNTAELFNVPVAVPVIRELSQAEQLDAVYIGIAPPGGKLPDSWRDILRSALERKLDIVSGLHDFLVDDPEYVSLANASGSRLLDVRKNRYKSTGSGRSFRPGNLRIHTVGHDCSVGKMVVTLELEKALKAAGHDAKFLATGQTGIMVSGRGVPIDCVVGDFVNGAAEELVAEHEKHDFLLIEGQGSISHPAFSAVTAGLLHGCAPDGLIFCYEAGRTLVKGLSDIPIAPLKQQIAALESMANLRHPCKVIGIAINTRTLSPEQAEAEVARAEQEYNLPACDVYRDGPEKLLQATIALRSEMRFF